jgi:hypothetical protein
MSDQPSEVATVTTWEQPMPYDPNNPLTASWDALSEGADVIEGYSLLSTEACRRLIGVPMMLVRASYRDGIGEYTEGVRNDYVSLEAVVAPMDVITKLARFGRINAAEMSVEPGEAVVFNDGSTGIYRQITAYLNAVGAITVNPKAGTLTMTGKGGDSAYDQPRSVWASGAEEATTGISIRLQAKRGLRFSQYSNEFGDAETFYLA